MDRGDQRGRLIVIGALVIVFRDAIEAALVIGIVAAAVQGLPHRGRHIACGTALGLAGSALVAAGLGVLSGLGDGRGQELFQAIVLCLAGLMLVWHNLYMAAHGREVAHRLRTLGDEVMQGAAPVTMVIGVTAIAVMREGSEVALFLYALAASGSSHVSLLVGGLLGLALGVALGYVLFLGLSHISVRRLFQVSGWLMLFIAAGMMGHAVMYLVNVGYLPGLVDHVWDSSFLLSGGSILGKSLAALAGYTPSPSLTQVLVWLAVFLGVGSWMLAKEGATRRAGMG